MKVGDIEGKIWEGFRNGLARHYLSGLSQQDRENHPIYMKAGELDRQLEAEFSGKDLELYRLQKNKTPAWREIKEWQLSETAARLVEELRELQLQEFDRHHRNRNI